MSESNKILHMYKADKLEDVKNFVTNGSRHLLGKEKLSQLLCPVTFPEVSETLNAISFERKKISTNGKKFSDRFLMHYYVRQ